MRFSTVLACLLAFAFGAQSQDATMADRIQYPPLARLARIQGDVVVAGGKAVSGNPLLVPIALEGLKYLNLADPNAEVVYHFIQIDAVVRTRMQTVPRGDAFDRVILRFLGIKTTKNVPLSDCVESQKPTQIDSTKTPIEVSVYGSSGCLLPDASLVASR